MTAKPILTATAFATATLLAACGGGSTTETVIDCPNGNLTPSGTPIVTTEGFPVRCGPQEQPVS